MAINRSLAALVSVSLFAAMPLAGLADDDRGQTQAPYQTCNQYGQCTQYGRGDNENDEHDRDNPHGCVNPAGHVRGWCKHHQRNGDNGYYGNNYGTNQQVQGVVTGVRGSSVTLLQGLSTISIDASQAFQRNDTNGPLYVTRSITAYGYYDGSGRFHAIEIR